VNERTCQTVGEEAIKAAVKDWQPMSRCFDGGIRFCGYDREKFGARSAGSIARSLLLVSCCLHGIEDLLFSNRRRSLNERLVDTIVNTGGNSCKKFESLRSLEAESFLLPSPPSLSFSFSLLPFECSCFSYFSS